MQKKADEYHGIDNRDLKLINVEAWEVPRPLRNPRVKEIMETIVRMEPGEMVKGYKGQREEAKLLQSSLWRLVKRHELGVKVILRGAEIYLKKEPVQ